MPRRCKRRIIVFVPIEDIKSILPPGATPPNSTNIFNNSTASITFTLKYKILTQPTQSTGTIPAGRIETVNFPFVVNFVTIMIGSASAIFNPQLQKSIIYNANGTITVA